MYSIRTQEDGIIGTDMHALASSGNLKDLERLVKSSPHLVHASDSNMWQPLHEASRGSNFC